MLAIRVLAVVLATATILSTALSAVHTFVLPRAAPVRLSRAVFIGMRFVILGIVRLRRTEGGKDDTLALFAPMSLLTLPIVWLAIIGAAYTAIYWAVDHHGWRTASIISGSSMFTLGFLHPSGSAGDFLTFSEAAFGIALLAQLITYLPSMYAAFARREAQVALLEGRAGRPPSAVTMIIRLNTIRAIDDLDDLWVAWEQWFIDVEESHLSLAALPFYRSPIPGRSWVTAAGTVLDAGALIESSVDVPNSPRAQLCVRTGFLALRRIADFYNIAYDADPAPDDPTSVTREDFDAAFSELKAAGVPMKRNRNQAWRDFNGWRVNYDTVVLSLARLTLAPPAPWNADHRMPPFRHPPVSRRARRAVQNRDGAEDRAG